MPSSPEINAETHNATVNATVWQTMSLTFLAWICILLLLMGALHLLSQGKEIVVLATVVLALSYALLAPIRLMSQGLEASKQFIAHRVITHAAFGWLQWIILKLPNRLLSCLLLALFVLLVGITIIFKVIPDLAHQISILSHHWPTYYLQIEESLNGWKVLPTQVLLAPLNQLTQNISHLLLNNIVTFSKNALAGFIYTLTGLVLMVYLLLDGTKMMDQLIERFPTPWQGPIRQGLTQYHKTLLSFVQNQCVFALFWGCWVYLGCKLLGLPYGLFFASCFMVLSLIPMLGLWGALAIMVFPVYYSQPTLVLLALLGWLFLGSLLKRWLFHKSVEKGFLCSNLLNVHPVMIVLLVLINIQWFGGWGIFVAYPCIAFLGSLPNQYAKPAYKHS